MVDLCLSGEKTGVALRRIDGYRQEGNVGRRWRARVQMCTNTQVHGYASHTCTCLHTQTQIHKTTNGHGECTGALDIQRSVCTCTYIHAIIPIYETHKCMDTMTHTYTQPHIPHIHRYTSICADILMHMHTHENNYRYVYAHIGILKCVCTHSCGVYRHVDG